MLGFAAALAFAGTAQAQDWKAQYPELTFARHPGRERLGHCRPLRPAHRLSLQGARREGDAARRQRLRRGDRRPARRQHPDRLLRPGLLRPRHHHRRRHRAGGRAAPQHRRSTGYYSVVYVRADSPYKTMDDLKGKKIALVDPNSTSGNNAPRYFLNKAGYTVDTYLRLQASIAGSHDNAVLALAQGTVDAAANSVELASTIPTLTPHADQGHSQECRRHADEEGRLPHRLQVGPAAGRPFAVLLRRCRPT